MKPKSPLVFRLDPGLTDRLEDCAARTRLKKYTLALLAIEAAVDAIEANDYKLVVPIKFNVAHVPVKQISAEQRAHLADNPKIPPVPESELDTAHQRRKRPKK